MDLTIPEYNLKHTRPIIGYGNFTKDKSASSSCYLDKSIVEKKFQMWDWVVENNILSSNDQMLRSQALSLLRDKTILAYSQFKFDGKPIKMMYMQDAILSDKSKRVLFCGCNQHIGKSFTLNVDAATEFITLSKYPSFSKL